MKVMIDLFCGLGGASSGFEDTEWKIIRIDNDKSLTDIHRNIWILDMRDWFEVYHIIKAHIYAPDVKEIFLMAGPPCTEFSSKNPNAPENPDTTLLENTLHVIEHLYDYCRIFGIRFNWIIENVKGAIQIFNREIGHEYKQCVGPFFFWGDFPFDIALTDPDLKRHKKPFNKTNGRIHKLRRGQIHAKIPYELSRSIRLTLDCQTSLTRWYL